MKNLLNIILTRGSVFGAIAMIACSSYLIRKNGPAPPPVRLSVAAPMAPDHSALAEEAGVTFPRRFISGVGIVEPCGEAVSIGSQLSGVIAKVVVQPGDKVKQGAPLFMLDDRQARASIKVAQAQLAIEEAKLTEIIGKTGSLRSKVDAARARIAIAEANFRAAERDLNRAKALKSSNVISSEELDQRSRAFSTCEAEVQEATALHSEAVANLDLFAREKDAPAIAVQQAAISQAIASLEREQVMLSLQTISAPKDSSVLQVNIREGEFVPAAVSPSPLVLLGVVDTFHIRVSIDEADITRFEKDSRAYASVRGRPELRAMLAYVRTEPYVIPKKSLSGSGSERVDTRVLQIIYSVDPNSLPVLPGQQVDIYIEDSGGG